MTTRAQPSLLAKTARGAGWVIGWRMATRILGLVSTLILVRLLVPGDFGLIALGATLAQAIDAFSILGVQDAIIREKSPGRAMYDTGFTLNALRGLLTAALLAGGAVPVAHFFDEPRLANVLYALAFGMVLSGLENVGIVDFRRDFAFEREFLLLIVPRILGIAAAIAFAVAFVNYWALVTGILTTRGSRFVMSYVMHPYRPRFTLAAWRAITGYSVWSWVVSVTGLLRDRSDSLVIGRIMDTTDVGVYSIGIEIASLPTTELVEPLGRACFSGFSAANHAGMSMSDTYLRVISVTSLLTLPAGFGISLVADPLIKLAFGPRWLDAVPLVSILAIGGTFTLFGYISSMLFSAQALLAVNFRITLASLALRVGLLITLVTHFGLVGAAIAAATSIAFEQLLYIGAILHRFAMRARGLLSATWRGLAATACMTIAMVEAGFGWRAVDGTARALGLHLAAACLFGAVVYLAALWAFWRVSGRPRGAEADVLDLVRRSVDRLLARAGRRARQSYAAGSGH